MSPLVRQLPVNHRALHHAAYKQHGVALVVALIMLVVMSLLGMAGIRAITMEERMATNTLDRSLVFQATEQALKIVEASVEVNRPVPVGAACGVMNTLMVCPIPLATAVPRWEDAAFASWENLASIGTGTLAVTPKYFVEFLGDTFTCDPSSPSAPLSCKRYRITAKVDSAGGRAGVTLQSVYATE